MQKEFEDIFITKSSDPKPELKDHNFLFGHLMCPFVEKARIALSIKKILYQKVEMDLTDRTKWYYEMNSEGKVPTLQLPSGDIIRESSVIANYADAVGDKYISLYGKDALFKVKVELQMIENDSFNTEFFKLYMTTGDGIQEMENINKRLRKFDEKLSKNKTSSFLLDSEQPTMADISFFPFFERLFWFFEGYNEEKKKLLGLEDLKSLLKWYSDLEKNEYFQKERSNKEVFLAMLKESNETGKKAPLRVPYQKL